MWIGGGWRPAARAYVDAAVKRGGIDLAALMGQLGQMGLTSLLIEGGAQVAGSALAADIVDKVALLRPQNIGRR
jgi:riboflavin biosynthesis pyrimidine reductase